MSKKSMKTAITNQNGMIFTGFFEKSHQASPPYGVIKVGDKWFACYSMHPAPLGSMIEALAQLHGADIHELTCRFKNFGISLKDCADENPSATLEAMKQACKEACMFAIKCGATQQQLTELREMRDGLNGNHLELETLLQVTLTELRKSLR